jgi:hypothetical protein
MRVDPPAILTGLKVEVSTKRIAGISCQANQLTSIYPLARHNIDLAQVAIHSQPTISMVNHHHIAVTTIPTALSDGHHPGIRRPDLSAFAGSYINPKVA